MSEILPSYSGREFIYVPSAPSKSYTAACATIENSPSASAILSRKCLEQLLQSFNKKERNLRKQIETAKRRPDFMGEPLFSSLADTIRRIGNIAAHPSDLESADHPFELEYEDARWCLQMLELLFDFFYEIPLDYEMRLTEFEMRMEDHRSRHQLC